MQQFEIIDNVKELLVLLKNKKFVIWGTGAAGCVFLKTFCEKYSIYPIFVLDKKIEKDCKFLGIKAINPYTQDLEKLKKDWFIVITIKKDWIVKDIKKFLEEKGFKNTIKLGHGFWFELEKKFWEIFNKKIWKTNQKPHLENYSKGCLSNTLKNSNGKTCVIHIGMHKTGSTSIQISLSNFKSEKFCYPKLNEDGNHSVIFSYIFMSYKEFVKKYKCIGEQAKFEFFSNKSFYLFHLKELFKKNKNAIFIFSGEDICNFDENALKKMYRFFKKYFNEIKIIAYVRDPFSYISSAFQEVLKINYKSLNNLYKLYPFYKKKFQKFYEVFGEENVILKKFDPLRFPDGCVVKDFCYTLGIPIKKENIIRINMSLSKEMISLIYMFRKKYQKVNCINLTFPLIILLEKLFGYKEIIFTPFKISKILIKPIVEKHKEDIEWIEAKLGEPLINEDFLNQPEEDYVIKSEEDLLTIPEELFERLVEYTNYRIIKTKPRWIQTAEMLMKVFKENFII